MIYIEPFMNHESIEHIRDILSIISDRVRALQLKKICFIFNLATILVLKNIDSGRPTAESD